MTGKYGEPWEVKHINPEYVDAEYWIIRDSTGMIFHNDIQYASLLPQAIRAVAAVNLCAGVEDLTHAVVVEVPPLCQRESFQGVVDSHMACSRACAFYEFGKGCTHGWNEDLYFDRPRPGGPCPRAPRLDAPEAPKNAAEDTDR